MTDPTLYLGAQLVTLMASAFGEPRAVEIDRCHHVPLPPNVVLLDLDRRTSNRA